MPRARTLLALLLLLPLLAVSARAGQNLVHDRLVVAEFKDALPPGWEVQVKAGQPKYRIVEGALHLLSRNDSYGLKRQIAVDLKQYPYLNWRWKALALPQGGDGRRASTDDQAAQVYVAFPRWPEKLRSQVICYTWENLAPRGSSFTTPFWGNTRYLVLRDRSDRLGEWVCERRNVHEDYRRLFGDTPPRVGAVLLYINSQHTKSTAESYIADVYFSKN